MEKTIKVNESTYKLLNKYAGELRAAEKRPVSMNEAVAKLAKERRKHSIMDFIGSWDMTNEEEEKMKKGLKKAWSTWKPKSF